MRHSHRKLCRYGARALVALSLVGFGIRPCIAQEVTVDSSAEAKAHYKYFEQQANKLSLVVAESGERLKLRESPLQSFFSGGPTYGSVYLWLDSQKKPAAVGTLGSLPIGGTDYGFAEIHWLLKKPLEPVMIGGGNPRRWAPSGQDTEGKRLDDVAPPAPSDTARLVQMRAIAREFEAVMIQGEQRNTLRLLTQPLYRYADSSDEFDGALFAWVWTIGTDPELLMHIYTEKNDQQTAWHYQPVRFTWRALELKRRNLEVWRADEFFKRNEMNQVGPYITTLTQAVELEPSK